MNTIKVLSVMAVVMATLKKPENRTAHINIYDWRWALRIPFSASRKQGTWKRLVSGNKFANRKLKLKR